jgi:hypothetical protein
MSNVTMIAAGAAVFVFGITVGASWNDSIQDKPDQSVMEEVFRQNGLRCEMATIVSPENWTDEECTIMRQQLKHQWQRTAYFRGQSLAYVLANALPPENYPEIKTDDGT